MNSDSIGSLSFVRLALINVYMMKRRLPRKFGMPPPIQRRECSRTGSLTEHEWPRHPIITPPPSRILALQKGDLSGVSFRVEDDFIFHQLGCTSGSFGTFNSANFIYLMFTVRLGNIVRYTASAPHAQAPPLPPTFMSSAPVTRRSWRLERAVASPARLFSSRNCKHSWFILEHLSDINFGQFQRVLLLSLGTC